jgi:hypothetical protein
MQGGMSDMIHFTDKEDIAPIVADVHALKGNMELSRGSSKGRGQ